MNLSKGIIIVFTLLVFSCETSNTEKLTVATAANVQFAMQELTQLFSQETGIETEIILGSSGKLLAQIKEGAPYDVFVSANMKYPDDLYNSGLTLKEPEIYAYGKLVLWSMKEGILPSLELLKKDDVKHIAMANPKTAPYGLATEQFLLAHNLYDAIKDKLVFGESISQTNQFIISGAAELGFTALSVVKSPEIAEKGKWIELDDNGYTPIAQGAVVIKKKDRNTEKAEQFYAFLFSPKARAVLEKYGYVTNEQP
ncbi:MAG: molybdate ABC transporter substrate-binding protein [Cyclobacteriaceae bacterium]|nr:molybdate ABC transporter substrate-binding protein [Cyclobacteriaceae bacterium]